jgi:hypothetical protein
VSSKAKPSTDPNEPAAQPGPAPRQAVQPAAVADGGSFARTHTLRAITGTTRRLHIPTNAVSHCGAVAATRPQERLLRVQKRVRMRVTAVAGIGSAPTTGADAARPRAHVLQPGGRAALLGTAAHGRASRRMLQGPLHPPLAFALSHPPCSHTPAQPCVCA